MTKLRKTMMMLVFILAVVLGITAGTGNAKAATTENFKGNLNVTYKSTIKDLYGEKMFDSKITIKKVNSKKVSIAIIANGNDWGKFSGKVISKDTIKVTDFPNVKFKWKDKTHFTSIRKGNGFGEAAQMLRQVCYALNNTKYTQVQKSSTVYYSSKGNPYKSIISIKEDKVIVKGKLIKGTKKAYADVKGKITKLNSKTRTFKLAKNVKFYGNGGANPKPSKITYNDAISSIKNKEGLDRIPFILTVKNGKVTRIDFYS